MITVTEIAKEKVLELMASKGRDDLALRIAIRGRGPGGFMYQLQFVPDSSMQDGDYVHEDAELKVFVDPLTLPDLEGATLDFVDEIVERGFKIENPNPLWRDPLANSVQEVLDSQINPAVAGHGGFVSLLDVRDNVAYIAFGGGCQGCGLADVTLKQGVDVMIREAIPSIRQVVDTTDHAAGTNPYYQPSKGGQSPLGSN
jgi:Fe/S biogenesis protein NfuA